MRAGARQPRPAIAEAAQRFAPSKRYWAIVGNGPNVVAAEEVRIKLSELCYKSIACDVTEDKKHIDLSSEPLILVCAAGLVGGTADDVGQGGRDLQGAQGDADRHRHRGRRALRRRVRRAHRAARSTRRSAFVLSAMVGHLFGYEAALAIDASARPLREAREVIERRASRSRRRRRGPARVSRGDRRRTPSASSTACAPTAYDGHLEASTAVRLRRSAARLWSATSPLEAYQRESGKIGTPSVLIDDLTAALTRAIEELTRPIDAIKHQAKTVTVGISRNDEGVLDRPLVQAVLAAGAGRDRLTYRTLKVLADLDPAVESVVGYTRYRIEGDPRRADAATISDRRSRRPVARRAEPRRRNTQLVGTKRRVASEREVLVARGRRDGRTVIFVPEVKGGTCTGITLLHVRFHDRLPAAVMRGVLQGYDHRYDRLVDWVSETEGTFRDDRLAELPVADLLISRSPTSPTTGARDRWPDHWARSSSRLWARIVRIEQRAR